MKWHEAAAASKDASAYRREPLSIVYVRFRDQGTLRVLNGKITPVQNLWDQEEDWEPTPIKL